MRITSFHVDGFGALSSFGEDDLAPGVVVVHGPNEAGKSTLFDFLSGVLFGFPPRRDNARFHPPVRGGRHGGRVSFTDESGGVWMVERHAGPQRGLRVQLPDGTPGEEHDLARVLAGASPSLFRAVFAIGIDDLGQLDSLTTDEVRELLFASSIFGQRRSATKVMKQLSDAQDGLARPRREGAQANRLARAIVETRGELAAARREMATFGDLSRRAVAAEEQVRALREQSRLERERERELELLLACWKPHARVESARAELTSLEAQSPPAGHTSASGPSLTHIEPELLELAAQISGHKERLGKLDELRQQRDGLAASVRRRLALLGTGWTPERLAGVAAPEVSAERARNCRRQLAELSGTKVTATALLEEAEAGLGDVLSQSDPSLTAAPAALGLDAGEVPGTTESLNSLRRRRSEIDSRRRAVNELREWMAELDEATAILLGNGRSIADGGRTDAAARTARLSLVLAAVAFCGIAFTLVAVHQPAIAAMAAFAAIVVVAAAVLPGRTHPAQRPQPAAETAAPAVLPGRARTAQRTHPAAETAAPAIAWTATSDATAIARRARHQVGLVAGRLGLAVPPSKVDVERLDVSLQSQSELAARLEEHWLARRRAEARLAAARCTFDEACRREQEGERAFDDWRRSCGFERAETPDSVLDSLASVAELQEHQRALSRIERAIRELERSVAGLSEDLERLRFLGPEADGADDDWTEERLEDRLRWLIELAGKARLVEQRRLSLVDEIGRAQIELSEALGSGERADRLRQELAGGEVLSWRQELDELETVRETLRHFEEEALREHQSVSEAMAHLVTSARVIVLEQRQAALENDLAHVLDQYLVLGTARALLRRTLSLHERERQPAVIAKAAGHFERVTAGRYVGLVPSAGPDGHQSIRALQANGATIDASDLSRGTIEQLYLCLRLGLADAFAERAVSLPVFLDDVLVNFDPARAEAVAAELAASAAGHQIIFFTCHPHLAELALKASSEGPVASQLLELSRL